MKYPRDLCIACLHVFVAYLCTVQCRESTLYMNQFAVHVPSGDRTADEIAGKHGFVNLGQVSCEFYVQNLSLCRDVFPIDIPKSLNAEIWSTLSLPLSLNSFCFFFT